MHVRPFGGASPQDCIKSQKRQQKIGDIALFPPGRKTRKLYILGLASQIIFMARTRSPFLSCAWTQKGGKHSVTAYGAAVWRPVVKRGAPAVSRKAAFADISPKTARSGTTGRGGFSRLIAQQTASRLYASHFDAGKELFTMSDRRTAFDAITKDKPTLAGFLRSLPVVEAPWDAAFQKRYCSSCTAENCDACANEQFRNNPEWWLSLPATEVEQ